MRDKKVLPFTILLIAIYFISACSASKSALSPNTPQIYLNSYQEVINATEKALKRADMYLLKAKEKDNKTYFIQYYKKRYDAAGQNNPDSGLGADLTIKKLSDKKTQVLIEEEQQPNLVPGSHKETLGRDVLRELKKLLKHESEVQ